MKNKIKEVNEEGIIITSYGDKISKELNVFYNPIMKLNRDISILVIKTYFSNYNIKKIKFCDPMGASGIRELRFLKTIPEMFNKITIGDISIEAINNIKNNFNKNKIPLDKIELKRGEAINTISSQYYDFIEIDPFGSPVPFIDIACQRIKHNGIISVTATDTAALCGTYPKTTLRRYNIKVKRTLFYDEIGLRNLIAFCQIQGAKYDKSLIPILSYSSDHYYKIFFKIEDGREKAFKTIKELNYIETNIKSQYIKINEFETKDSIGKTFTKNFNDKEFLKKVLNNIELINDKKKVEKLIYNLLHEGNEVGYYIPAKLQKEYKLPNCPKFEIIKEELIKLNYTYSRPHNNRFGIKTNANPEIIVKIIRENKDKNKIKTS